MAAINQRRVVLGAVAGGVVWAAWTIVVHVVILGSQYASAQEAGQILDQPRYSLFPLYWNITLFILSYILAWLYARVRAVSGPGPRTALTIGFVVGFAIAVPANFSIAAWVPFSRIIALWWMLDLWVGAILATFVAGWVYRD